MDGTTQPAGWLGFSEPFVAHADFGRDVWAVLQLACTTCLAIALLYGPGLLWFHARDRGLPGLALAILPGPLLLVALGLLCWIGGAWVAPVTLARVGVVSVLAWLWLRTRANHFTWRLPDAVTAVLAAALLLVGFAVAKATYSGGPAGELFHGSIARSLAVGGHSDSRISYQGAQLVAHGLSPVGSEAQGMFAPWSFGSRGPLSGLAAAPVALATSTGLPRRLPDHAWTPFDPTGFAAYRIAMIVLASLCVWPVVTIVVSLTAPASGIVAAVLVLLSPFYVHETYFTWPKLICAGLALTAFLLGNRGRAFAAGATLGTAYLFHPLAALSAPFLALWLLVRAPASPIWQRLREPVLCAAGMALLVVPWQILGRINPGEGATQSVFFSYFSYADNQPGATAQQWLRARWDNFANTFIPGYLLLGDPAHESVNSHYGTSAAWVRRSFVYWNTLPFALGIPGFLAAAAAIGLAVRRAPGIVFVTFAGPALLLIVYWGAASTGLMRHCGHVLFLSTIALASWSLARHSGTWSQRALRVLLHPACFAWRACEIALVAFATTLAHRPPSLHQMFGWNDVLSLATAIVCLLLAVRFLYTAAGSVRPMSHAGVSP